MCGSTVTSGLVALLAILTIHEILVCVLRSDKSRLVKWRGRVTYTTVRDLAAPRLVALRFQVIHPHADTPHRGWRARKWVALRLQVIHTHAVKNHDEQRRWVALRLQVIHTHAPTHPTGAGGHENGHLSAQSSMLQNRAH